MRLLKYFLLQASQNADFFVVDRRDFLGNTTTNLLPGQRVTIASGKPRPALSLCLKMIPSEMQLDVNARSTAVREWGLLCTLPAGPMTLDFARATTILHDMATGRQMLAADHEGHCIPLLTWRH